MLREEGEKIMGHMPRVRPIVLAERRQGDDERDSFINSTEKDVKDQGGTSRGGNDTDDRDRSK